MSHLARLTLTNFRNYARLRVEAKARPIVLTGPNGAGKTNLLEAISLLVPGRGLRGAKSAEMRRQGAAGGWAVAAEMATPIGTIAVGTASDGASASAGDRRVVRIDGANRSQGALAELASLVWLTPAMDRLFSEPASARRRFLDRIVYGFDPAHATRLNRYEHALRERQKLLETSRHPAWLDGIETVMAETGVAVAASRLGIVEKLDAACAASGDAAFPMAQMQVEGEVETQLLTASALETEDWLRARLAANRVMDAAAGRCGTGIHRSDFAVTYGAKTMPAGLCSTGEQKALLISILLANAELLAVERGSAPILLLDEITAHLDPERQQALFARIGALGLQAWMTGTDAGSFAGLDNALRYEIVDGAVRPA